MSEYLKYVRAIWRHRVSRATKIILTVYFTKNKLTQALILKNSPRKERTQISTTRLGLFVIETFEFIGEKQRW